jgi:chromosome segregation and condensation protein ScpB
MALTKGKKKPGETTAPGAIAARAVVQWLFTSNKSFTIEGVRDRLREYFKDEVKSECRAVAALSTVELVSALLKANETLNQMGLQLRIVNGVVSLMTDKVSNGLLAAHLREITEQSGNPDLTTAALEVLACVAFKQPISQSEINHLFDTDKRGFVVRLRELDLIEDCPGEGGRVRFVTTEAFLRRFNLSGVDDLRRQLEAGRL